MKIDIDGQKTFSKPTTPVMVNDTFACTPENKPIDVPSSEPCDATSCQVFCTKEPKNRSQVWNLAQIYFFNDFVVSDIHLSF